MAPTKECEDKQKLSLLEKDFSYMKEKLDEILDIVKNLDNKYAKKSSVDKIRRVIRGVVIFVFTILGGVLMKIILNSDFYS